MNLPIKAYSLCFALLISFSVQAQIDGYSRIFKKKKVLVTYDFAVSNDSISIIGKVVDTKGNNPITGVNISLPTHRQGTVSRVDGSFVLYLPVRSGRLYFDHSAGWEFSMPFEVSQPILTIERNSPTRPNSRGH